MLKYRGLTAYSEYYVTNYDSSLSTATIVKFSVDLLAEGYYFYFDSSKSLRANVEATRVWLKQYIQREFKKLSIIEAKSKEFDRILSLTGQETEQTVTDILSEMKGIVTNLKYIDNNIATTGRDLLFDILINTNYTIDVKAYYEAIKQWDDRFDESNRWYCQKYYPNNQTNAIDLLTAIGIPQYDLDRDRDIFYFEFRADRWGIAGNMGGYFQTVLTNINNWATTNSYSDTNIFEVIVSLKNSTDYITIVQRQDATIDTMNNLLASFSTSDYSYHITINPNIKSSDYWLNGGLWDDVFTPYVTILAMFYGYDHTLSDYEYQSLDVTKLSGNIKTTILNNLSVLALENRNNLNKYRSRYIDEVWLANEYTRIQNKKGNCYNEAWDKAGKPKLPCFILDVVCLGKSLVYESGKKVCNSVYEVDKAIANVEAQSKKLVIAFDSILNRLSTMMNAITFITKTMYSIIAYKLHTIGAIANKSIHNFINPNDDFNVYYGEMDERVIKAKLQIKKGNILYKQMIDKYVRGINTYQRNKEYVIIPDIDRAKTIDEVYDEEY